ncbi:MAG: DUF2975 domain-containing protein [Oscillospiraceae bacterium]|nr:DUF2975 domain-containing protein [Oscillospiraceae bacterium]
MEQTSVQKLARVLRVMVLAVFVCNIIVLFFVPALAAMLAENRWDGQTMERLLSGESVGFWLNFTLHMWNPFIWMMAAVGEEQYWLVLTAFLLFCGVCTAIILWQGRRVLDTILKGSPFVMDNAKSLKTAAMCCFLISGAALARLVWGFAYYRSIMPMLTYNALFVPIFLMGGLLFMVMCALFRQAVELKAENGESCPRRWT